MQVKIVRINGQSAVTDNIQSYYEYYWDSET